MTVAVRDELVMVMPFPDAKLHSVRFNAHENPKLAAKAALPSIYVPNSTLESLGYAPGRKLEVTLKVVD
jgi:hypothetical protein